MKYKKFIIRTIWISLLAVVIITLFKIVVPVQEPLPESKKNMAYPIGIVVMNIMINGILWFDRKLDLLMPWFYYTWQRLIVESLVTVLVAYLVLYIPKLIVKVFLDHPMPSLSEKKAQVGFFFIMLIVLLCINFIVARNFFNNWKKSLVEIERLKREKLKSDYQALQNQLNPHFLFNNFNVLIAEIRHDPETAIRFTEELSEVYRYVLQSKNHETVSLEEEPAFMESYVYLHKIRFGDRLRVDADIPDEFSDRRLPPLTLQILLENAVKHNVISDSKPLNIQVYVDDRYLVVKNNKQLKDSTYSTETGLENIRKRYSFLTLRKVRVEEKDDEFIAMVPLME